MRNLAPASKSAPKEFVTVRGQKYYVRGRELRLSVCRITDIDEIKGLGSLTASA